jgi:ribonucleoside-triphosphate reductase
VSTSRNSLVYFAASIVVLAVCSLVFYLLYPAERGLLWLALYTIPSHMFISPFSHEPVLLYFAKYHSAILCAVASLVGCLIAGVWDYWLFIPLMHHPKIRAKYANFSLYQRSVALFRKTPFGALVLVGLTPIPFYPIKFLSFGEKYPLKRYLLALVVGRTPRYWAIAYLGHMLKLPNWSLIVLALALLLVTVVKGRMDERKKRLETNESASDDVEATCPPASLKSTRSGK